MKRIISFIILFVLFTNCFVTDISAVEMTKLDIEKDKNVKIDDPYSEVVLQNDMFQESKIKKCENRLESIQATGQLIENNSVKMNKDKDELFVDNCVIVNSSQEIAFDTSKVISSVYYDDMYYIQYETVVAANEAIEVLEQYPSVTYAVTDEVVYVDAMKLTSIEKEASPLLGKDGYTHHSWGITQTGLDIFAEYVSNNATGSVDIAVVDSGVYASHPFLQEHISGLRYDLFLLNGDAEDLYGHGTFVTGIIVDAMQNLSFSIIPVRVLDANGNSTASCIAQGIMCAADSGADVINASLGWLTSDTAHVMIDTAIEYAIDNNVVVVATAGNESRKTEYKCPAHLPEPIIVSGIDKEGEHCDFSNKGETVDVAGPALDVKSCAIPTLSNTGYGTGQGTSFAAPHITAAAAMLRLLYPSYSATKIQDLINLYVDDVGDVGKDDKFGYGLMKISNKIITVPFTDVSQSDYFYDGVYSGYGRGYISGLTSTTFGPNFNMQRQDVAVVLYKMAGSPNVTYRNIFSDVGSGHYFAKAAVWAYDNGIISGLVGGSLGVGQPITREDFVVMLSRYAQYRGMDTSAYVYLGGYPDKDYISDYAMDAVHWAVKYNIMGNDDYLWPQNNITRAEIVFMIYKFLCL